MAEDDKQKQPDNNILSKAFSIILNRYIPSDAIPIFLTRLCQDSDFQKDSDPIAPLWAFYFAYLAGETPPQWVLDYLAKGIASFLARRSESLDMALGLNIKGKGKTQPRDKNDKELRDITLVFLMAILEEVFGKTSKEAAQEVANIKGVTIGVRTLEDLHGEKAANIRKFVREIHKHKTPEEMQSLWNLYKDTFES